MYTLKGMQVHFFEKRGEFFISFHSDLKHPIQVQLTDDLKTWSYTIQGKRLLGILEPVSKKPG